MSSHLSQFPWLFSIIVWVCGYYRFSILVRLPISLFLSLVVTGHSDLLVLLPDGAVPTTTFPYVGDGLCTLVSLNLAFNFLTHECGRRDNGREVIGRREWPVWVDLLFLLSWTHYVRYPWSQTPESRLVSSHLSCRTPWLSLLGCVGEVYKRWVTTFCSTL